MTTMNNDAQGAVPQSVADEISALASEVKAAQRAAERSWRVTAGFFVVLLLFIVIYLSVIYNLLHKKLSPETVVQLGFQQVEKSLQGRGLPALNQVAIQDWATKTLKERAPELLDTQVKPALEQLVARAPELRAKLVEWFNSQAPQLIDQALSGFQTQVLPELRARAVQAVTERALAGMDQIDAQIEAMVSTVVEQHKANLADLRPENMENLRTTLEGEFEQQLGPILDQMFQAIGTALTQTETGLSDLVQQYQAGSLVEGSEPWLEMRLVQLIRALFSGAVHEPGTAPATVEPVTAPEASAPAPAASRPVAVDPAEARAAVEKALAEVNASIKQTQDAGQAVPEALLQKKTDFEKQLQDMASAAEMTAKGIEAGRQAEAAGKAEAAEKAAP